MMNCDAETGVCMIPDADEAPQPAPLRSDGAALRYIGDPMCSWCWGISPTVSALAEVCSAHGIEFSVTVGGLRAGGGDAWTPGFKDFLRGEWSHIAQVTGQPFGYALLDAQDFNYDTEPSCRAVVTVQMLVAAGHLPVSTTLAFFSAVQRKFYVDGQDPKDVAFYADICAPLGLDYEDFQRVFGSQAARENVSQAFAQARQWGVRSFPTLVIDQGGRLTSLAVGFVKMDEALERLRQAFNLPSLAR